MYVYVRVRVYVYKTANTVFTGQTDNNIGDRADVVAIFISAVCTIHRALARVHDPCFSRRFRATTSVRIRRQRPETGRMSERTR